MCQLEEEKEKIVETSGKGNRKSSIARDKYAAVYDVEREKLECFTMEEKALAFEHWFKGTEQGKTGNKSFFKCSDIDAEKTRFDRREMKPY